MRFLSTTLGLSLLAYSFMNSLSSQSQEISRPIRVSSGKVRIWVVWVLSVLVLVSAGIAYRIPAQRIGRLGEDPIALPVPLDEFPAEVGQWVGREIEMRSTTKGYIRDNFADDFFSRRYDDSAGKGWADVYVVYCSSRPGGILGHRPRVCYPAHGWQHRGSEAIELTTVKGRKIDCLLHSFYKAPPEYYEMTVLSFYVVSGRVTASEREFSGPLGRRPNIARDPSRYVAQVQIGSTVRKSVESAFEEMADEILDFLPATDGEEGVADGEKSKAG